LSSTVASKSIPKSVSMVHQGERGPSLREKLQARAGFRQRFCQIEEKFPAPKAFWARFSRRCEAECWCKTLTAWNLQKSGCGRVGGLL
jgi:hypothetical protein